MNIQTPFRVDTKVPTGSIVSGVWVKVSSVQLDGQQQRKACCGGKMIELTEVLGSASWGRVVCQSLADDQAVDWSKPLEKN